jgi:hypothetical protein
MQRDRSSVGDTFKASFALLSSGSASALGEKGRKASQSCDQDTAAAVLSRCTRDDACDGLLIVSPYLPSTLESCRTWCVNSSCSPGLLNKPKGARIHMAYRCIKYAGNPITVISRACLVASYSGCIQHSKALAWQQGRRFVRFCVYDEVFPCRCYHVACFPVRA